MSVVIETTLGDVTVDLFLKERPRACVNFLKLCKMKYYNFSLFHTISRNFIAQTGDPTGSRHGGESVYGVLEGPLKRYFQSEKNPRIKHTTQGLISFVGNEDGMIGSQFFITLGTELTYLDERHCVFGEIMEGLDVLDLLNETICDGDNRPYKDVRITHTVILDDPYPDIKNLRIPERSPSPNPERLQGGRIAADEDIDDTEGKTNEEINEMLAEREAKARATILEMVGDLPDAEMAPPENVLFVCKLNPVTTDNDLEIIFSRFGKIVSCEVIRDKKSGDSLQYAFVEFTDQKSCEDAYFKMDNVLIDDRRIHVDFSQSVSKIKWHGKGRGITTYDDHGRKSKDDRNDIGQGRYKRRHEGNFKKNVDHSRSPDRKKSYRSPQRGYENKQNYENRGRIKQEDESRSLDRHPREDERHTRQNDRYSRQDERYTRHDDRVFRQDERHSRQNERYSRQDERYSRQDDRYPKQNDRYAKQDDRYANQDDRYTKQDDRNPREDKYSRQDSRARRENERGSHTVQGETKSSKVKPVKNLQDTKHTTDVHSTKSSYSSLHKQKSIKKRNVSTSSSSSSSSTSSSSSESSSDSEEHKKKTSKKTKKSKKNKTKQKHKSSRNKQKKIKNKRRSSNSDS